jgi:transglutaminase-like putative cysteine protease
MRNLANRAASNPDVQSFALPFLDAESAVMLRRLDNWIRAHFVYRGEIEEVLRTPEFMLDTLERLGYFDGDCDDISTLYAALAKALHFQCRFVAIRYDASPEFKHVFLEVWLGRWVAVDPTVPEGTPYTETERMVLDV